MSLCNNWHQAPRYDIYHTPPSLAERAAPAQEHRHAAREQGRKVALIVGHIPRRAHAEERPLHPLDGRPKAQAIERMPWKPQITPAGQPVPPDPVRGRHVQGPWQVVGETCNGRRHAD